MLVKYLHGKCRFAFFCSKINSYTLLSLILLGTVCCGASCFAEEDFNEELLKSESNFVETGELNGKVIDAVTGEPLENAIVVCKWNIRVFFIESSTTPGALYETATDKNGSYVIPNQSIKIDTPALSRLEPEELIVYKPGYLWYRVNEGQASSFMIYLPNLTEDYKKQNNTIKLQPWIDEFSHQDHIEIFERNWNYPKSPLLEKSLQQERTLAQNSIASRREQTQDVKQIPTQKEHPTVRPGAGMIALRRNRDASANPGGRGYGAGVLAIGGERDVQEDPREAQERKIREIKGKLNKLCSDYKQGNIPEDAYKTQLREYLEVSDEEVLAQTAAALKELDDYSAIPVLIEYLKQNLYRKWNFTRALYSFRTITGRMDLPESTDVIAERQEIVRDCEQWWQRNKDKSESEWHHDLIVNGKTDAARITALATVRNNKDRSALPSVLQCLNNKEDSAIYEQAISALSEIGNETVIPDIKKKL